MEVISAIAELKRRVGDARQAGRTVGLVPTMGALHAGHLSLVDRACRECDFVVVSIFVNPTQFNNPDDLRTYPRTLDADVALLEGRTRADVAFAPAAAEVYPRPDTRVFQLGPVAEVMEGPRRPGHFNGVCQIVSKLFAYVSPDKAFFGEKDFQQIAVIREMVRRCDFKVDVVACPIVREADGLALSSRNTLLTPRHRAAAPLIHKVLGESRGKRGEMSPSQLKEWVVGQIDASALLAVEYFEIVDALSLQPVNDWAETNAPVGCVTVQAGDVRLIDNITY